MSLPVPAHDICSTTIIPLEMQTSRDVSAVILSYLHMTEQLKTSTVCLEWQVLVRTHPILLSRIDLGNPECFPVHMINSILIKAGSRVRHLQICTFSFSWINRFSGVFVGHDLLTAIGHVVKNLEHLCLVGHLPQTLAARFPLFPKEEIITLLKTSKAATLKITLVSCPCAMNWFDELVVASTAINGPTLSLHSPMCRIVSDQPILCTNCGFLMKWQRYCPRSDCYSCSGCSFLWDWSPEWKFSHQNCSCNRCKLGTQTYSPPLWICTHSP